MDIPTEVRRIAQEWLSDRHEDRATLQGSPSGEWHMAHTRLLIHVYQRMRKLIGDEWREWVKIQAEVQRAVNEICEELRK